MTKFSFRGAILEVWCWEDTHVKSRQFVLFLGRRSNVDPERSLNISIVDVLPHPVLADKTRILCKHPGPQAAIPCYAVAIPRGL